ncbi:MAG: double-strand break repair protein AddB [Rhodospirillales bacterium]|nr:double-strand break repair protein AddB [Rhodospirillales bacterium]
MIWTIPSHVPFLDALAAGLLERTDGDPVALTEMTVLLPTRRACRALRDAFLRRSVAKALLLPRLRAVGAIGDDEEGLGDELLELPPAMSELRRRLLLTRLVMARRLLPAQAAALARELARLLDEVESVGGALDPARLAALAPDAYAEHWQEVLTFLRILVDHWPAILAAEGALEPVARRNAALRGLAERWRRAPPAKPVIAAGFSGALPALAELLGVVKSLPAGEIVLAGLDPAIGAAEAADETHPQHELALLLEALDIAPEAVAIWPSHGVEAGNEARAALAAAAMRPAGATDLWREVPVPAGALDRLWRLDCAGPQEEALAIALLLREQLEFPGKTAALVTPDRDLARRVAGELRRWGIEIDDSAGVPLARTPPGSFLRLLLEAARELAPVPLLALLKHPLAGGGMAVGAFRALVRRLELKALRGPRPAPGFRGLRAAVGDRTELLHVVDRLERILGALAAELAREETTIGALLRATVDAAEALAATDSETGAARLWAEEAGEAAARFIADLAEAARDFPVLRGEDWPALFEALLAGPVVRPRFGRHPRLVLLGLMEARLLQFDLVVLGGLNEGTWPGEPGPDPWMSRPMRRALGLPSPERRIGVEAHDFVQALGAPKVVMTRATRVDGTPTVPSRWLQRLDAVLEARGINPDRLQPKENVLGWAALLDRPSAYAPVERPRPRPPVALRPKRLSVTRIETWLKDPYSIFAREILRLRPLEPLDADPGAAGRGQFVHEALDAFIAAHPEALPPDAVARLEACGRAALGELLDRPGVWAFWWPRFERVARWFVAAETARRRAISGSFTEIAGTLELDGFTLTGKADRIDRLPDGSVAIVDYKTGRPPSRDDVASGRSPQLALEAAIAAAGGFAALGPAPVAALEYWRVSGLRTPGEISVPASGVEEVASLVEDALSGLRALVARFADEATPYVPLARLRPGPVWGDYLHLARVKEWMPAVETRE